MEETLAEVRIHGAGWFDEEVIERGLHQKRRECVDDSELDRKAHWLRVWTRVVAGRKHSMVPFSFSRKSGREAGLTE